MTMTKSSRLAAHMESSSKGVRLPARASRSAARNSTPAHSVTRKMLEPAVLATIMPGCWRAPEKTATSFSGSVVASESSVMPSTEPASENVSASVLMLCEST